MLRVIFEDCKLFRDVVHSKSLSRAALLNGISQSAATQHVQDLEKRLGAELLVLNVDILGTGQVGAAEREGLEVWCYTANDVGMVAACAAMGVTGIITDRPDLIRTR